jgi:hypothetical protein
MRRRRELKNMRNLAVYDSGSVQTIVKETLGVDQLYSIMSELRGRYNRTTDRARRARMRRVIDVAAIGVVNDFRRYYVQHNEEDSD